MAKQTAVEWLYSELTNTWYDEKSSLSILEQAKAIEKEQMINFYYWMKINDNEKNAEMFFGFNDSDMIDQYYNEIFNK